jgi:hypothetical protein
MIDISKVVEISILNHKGSLRNCLIIIFILCISVKLPSSLMTSLLIPLTKKATPKTNKYSQIREGYKKGKYSKE